MSTASDERRHLVMTGMMVGRPSGMEFEADMDFKFCLICGSIFQDGLCRNRERTPAEDIECQARKVAWAERHARTHPARVHEELRVSGRLMTPEAAAKAIGFGIIPIGDMVLDDEVAHALRVSSSTPADDAEGG